MTLISLLLPIIAGSAVSTPVPVLKAEDAPIRLWMNNEGRFREGDFARVQVDAETNGFLLVLQYDTYGRLRVLFPMDPRDDNRVQAGRRYEVRDDGGQYAFRADGDGPGLIYSAISPDPWRLDDIVRDGRWDYDRISIGRDSEDPEREITDLAQNLAGPGGFDYDVQDYRVYGQTTGNSTVVYRDYGGYGGYGYDLYRYCDWYWSYSGCRSVRFGLSYGYDPFYYYGYPSRYSSYYPYYPRVPVVVHPRTPSAVVTGRPRNYTVTPVRPRGSVVAPSIDWRTRGDVRSSTARPARPRSERNDFRRDGQSSGRQRAEAPSRPEARSRPEAGSRPEARSRPQSGRAAPERGGNNGRRESGNSGGQARGNSGGQARGNWGRAFGWGAARLAPAEALTRGFPPRVIEAPLQQVRAAQADLHGSLDRLVFAHPAVQDEIGNQHSPHPVGTGAMKQGRPAGVPAQLRQRAIHHGIVQGALHHRHIHVLHPQPANRRRFIQRPRLHGVADVEDHFGPRRFQRLEMRGAGLS